MQGWIYLWLLRCYSMQTIQLADRDQTERCFNLFVFVEDGIIYELGAYFHNIAGIGILKMAALQERMYEDLKRATRHSVPSRYVFVDPVNGTRSVGALSYETFRSLSAEGVHLELFEEVLAALGAGDRPMLCITPVEGGKIPPLAVVPIAGVRDVAA